MCHALPARMTGPPSRPSSSRISTMPCICCRPTPATAWPIRAFARLTQAGLDRLFVAARRQADRSHQGILLLLDLLAACRSGHRFDGLVAGMARQLRHHLEDQQRWQALADNAAYYRDTAKSPNASPRDCCRRTSACHMQRATALP